MGVPTSEVCYTPAMPRREDHEVHKDMWGALDQKKKDEEIAYSKMMLSFDVISGNLKG